MAENDPCVGQHLSRDIRGKVDTIRQSALFLPDHLQAYKEEPGMKKGLARKGLLSLIHSVITKLCDTTLHYGVRWSSLTLLFRFSLVAYCKGEDNKEHS